MSDQDLALLSSFLRGGIDVAPGKKETSFVGLDPQEYFSQVIKSWVPTLAESRQATRYF
jgi:hypothetical protein